MFNKHMENLNTKKIEEEVVNKGEMIGEITDILLITLYQNFPNIDSRIDFFKRGINGERFSQEIQAKFGQRLISFQKGLDTIAIVSGIDIENNIHTIPIDDNNGDIYESSINPYVLLDKEDSDLSCLV